MISDECFIRGQIPKPAGVGQSISGSVETPQSFGLMRFWRWPDIYKTGESLRLQISGLDVRLPELPPFLSSERQDQPKYVKPYRRGVAPKEVFVLVPMSQWDNTGFDTPVQFSAV